MQKCNIIVVLREDEVLMQFKLRGPFSNMWNFPGGKIEETDNHVKTSAVRELKEETNIEVNCNELVYLAEFIYHHVCPVNLHILAYRVDKNTQFTQCEDEPLTWTKTQLIIDNKLPTAGYLNVPHIVQLAVEFYKNLDKETGGSE